MNEDIVEIEEETPVITPRILTSYTVEKELKSMINLFSVQSYSKQEQDIRNFILKQLKGRKDLLIETDLSGNLLITKGKLKKDEFYPCLMAHMDTVFPKTNGYKVNKHIDPKGNTILYATCYPRIISEYKYDAGFASKIENKVSSDKTGIGGDDKCGIWIGLKLLNELPKVKVVFTVQEETGGQGTYDLDLKFFEDVGYIIEGDRRGNSDVITKIFDNNCSQDFVETITPLMDKFGYGEENGMFTDIDVLLDSDVGVSCINVSVGYYNPHSNDEFVVVEDLLEATQFIKECVKTLGNNKYPFLRPRLSSYKGCKSGYYSDNYWDDYYEDYEQKGWKNTKKCTCNEAQDLLDIDCEIHNPIIQRFSGFMCNCGEELEKREFTLSCPYCAKHYIL